LEQQLAELPKPIQ